MTSEHCLTYDERMEQLVNGWRAQRARILADETMLRTSQTIGTVLESDNGLWLGRVVAGLAVLFATGKCSKHAYAATLKQIVQSLNIPVSEIPSLETLYAITAADDLTESGIFITFPEQISS